MLKDSQPTVAALQKWMEVSMRHSMHKFILFSKENNISMSQMGALFFIHHPDQCCLGSVAEDGRHDYTGEDYHTYRDHQCPDIPLA